MCDGMLAEAEWTAGHEMIESSTSSALALSFPLHRLEPYCTCVWIDPLIIASGHDLPPVQALPATEDDTPREASGSVGIAHSPGATSMTAAYILPSEPMETDRQNVADIQDGARVLFANPYASHR